MQMDVLYEKWKSDIAPMDRDQFYADLVSMMEYYRQRGADSERVFPRTEGS